LRPNDPHLPLAAAEIVWSEMLANSNVSVVIGVDLGAIVSSCMLGVVPNLANGGRPFAVIEHVITAPSHRRKGFGRAVLEFTLAVAWSRQCYKVVLLSGAERSEAHRLYESVGFRSDTERGFVAKPN
jgi:GNAT superfamily N-acetyltransferase